MGVQAKLDESGAFRIRLTGRLDFTTTGQAWRELLTAYDRSASGGAMQRVVIDASQLDYCDGAGIGLFVELQRRQLRAGNEIRIDGLSDDLRSLLGMYQAADFVGELRDQPPLKSLPMEAGEYAIKLGGDAVSLITFVGELTAALVAAFLNPRRVRWRDALQVAEAAGAKALPIAALIGFLIGLILAFQSAIPLRLFGADLFVADLVGFSIVRELGPLLTAIVLAARSGSAFAAELGTMKVNEEIDALVTMGLDPLRFLVVTRVVAAIAIMPLLTIFVDLAALVGGAVVFLYTLGYPLTTYINELTFILDVGDLLGGLVKSVVFGVLVAGVGCLRGMQTKSGATAVGEATTSSVVSALILIFLADGVLSVAYYYLGI